MMIWSPDTCGCVLTYSESSNVGTPIEAIPCDLHMGLSVADLGQVVHNENQMKNDAMTIATLSPAMQYHLSPEEKAIYKLMSRINSSGSKIVEPPDIIQHPDKGVEWKFDEKRKVVLTLTGFSLEEKQSITTTLETEIGKEKVTLIDKEEIIP